MSWTVFPLPTLMRLMSKTKMPFSTRPLMNLCKAGRGEASCKKSALGAKGSFLLTFFKACVSFSLIEVSWYICCVSWLPQVNLSESCHITLFPHV